MTSKDTFMGKFVKGKDNYTDEEACGEAFTQLGILSQITCLQCCKYLTHSGVQNEGVKHNLKDCLSEDS